tara:strand:- start:491 stop:739 length:249 start_codon:yes stop_codon:yes gene_type:complete
MGNMGIIDKSLGLDLELFAKVVAHFGSKSKLADALGVHRSSVTQFIKMRHLPAARAVEIEIATDGMFLARELIGITNVRADV